jgi:hypothetical protein
MDTISTQLLRLYTNAYWSKNPYYIPEHTNSNSGSNISSTLYRAAILPGLVESLACKKKMRDQDGN